MKRNIWLMVFCVVGFFALCTVAYYQSYKRMVNEQNNVLYKTKEPAKTQNSAQVVNDGQTISAKCQMTVICHEVSDDSEEQHITAVLPEYVGMDVNMLNDRLTYESTNPELSEIDKGFIRAELVSFAPKSLVIKRYYSKNDIPDKYFMVLEDNYVTIYYADRKTVFENTGISRDKLRADEIVMLNEGIAVKDEHTLFSILEGYTS